VSIIHEPWFFFEQVGEKYQTASSYPDSHSKWLLTQCLSVCDC